MSVSRPRAWPDRAAEDLAVARLVFPANHFAHVCFLCEQSMEKSLKAFLLARASAYPRTHKLIDLLGECQAIEPSFSSFLAACTIVDQYYMPTRYPDSSPGGSLSGLPQGNEAQEALEATEKLLQFVGSLGI